MCVCCTDDIYIYIYVYNVTDISFKRLCFWNTRRTPHVSTQPGTVVGFLDIRSNSRYRPAQPPPHTPCHVHRPVRLRTLY